jgi:hypothetical protein
MVAGCRAANDGRTRGSSDAVAGVESRWRRHGGEGLVLVVVWVWGWIGGAFSKDGRRCPSTKELKYYKGLGNRLTDMWGHGRGIQMGRAQKQRGDLVGLRWTKSRTQAIKTTDSANILLKTNQIFSHQD